MMTANRATRGWSVRWPVCTALVWLLLYPPLTHSAQAADAVTHAADSAVYAGDNSADAERVALVSAKTDGMSVDDMANSGGGPTAVPGDPWAFANSASAAGGAQPEVIKRVQQTLRSVQDDYLEPCIRGKHETCRQNMVEFIGLLKAQQQTVSTWSLLEPIRNNMYFYLLAPSLRLATAIVRSGGACGEWQTQAGSAGLTLTQLLRDANQEVGRRTALPEFKQLDYLQRRLNGCLSAGNDD